MCNMKKYNKMIKGMNWQDIAALKVSVIGFALMIAKLWKPLLSMDWYWYGLIFIVPCVILMKRLKMF